MYVKGDREEGGGGKRLGAWMCKPTNLDTSKEVCKGLVSLVF